MFFMENVDPHQDFFPWVIELAVLMFWIGAVMMAAGLIVFMWRLFA
jgi:hypothetical protein